MSNCKVCEYLQGFDNDKISSYLNSLIVEGLNYDSFIEEANKTDLNDINIPSEYLIKKHKSNCLKDFKSTIDKIEQVEEVKEEKEDIVLPENFHLIDDYKQSEIIKKNIKEILHIETSRTLEETKKNRLHKDHVSNIKNLYDLSFNNDLDISDISLDGDDSSESVILKLTKKILNGSLTSNKELIDLMKLFKPKEYEFNKNESDSALPTINLIVDDKPEKDAKET